MKSIHNFLLFIFTILFFGIATAQNLLNDEDKFLLANQYAPDFYFAQGEKYLPCDISNFFNGKTDAEAIAEYNSLSRDEKLKNFEIFYSVKQYPDEIAIQYWQFYVFNDFVNQHYGDAEHLTIFIDPETKNIKRAVGSAHYGTYTKVVATNNQISGVLPNHIGVLVEKGSHVNFPDKNNNLKPDLKELDNWLYASGIYDWPGIGVVIDHFKPYYRLTPLPEQKIEIEEYLGLPLTIKIDLWLWKIDKTIYIPVGGKPLEEKDIESQDPSIVSPFDSEREQPLPDAQPVIAKKETIEAPEEQTIIIPPREIKYTDKQLADKLKDYFDSLPRPEVAGTSTEPVEEEIIILPPEIKISEICAGIYDSKNEFIELYNSSQEIIDLYEAPLEMHITNSKGKSTRKKIKFNTQYFEPETYYLLAPDTIDIAMTEIEPDGTYSAGVVHTGCITLKDAEGELLDTLSWGEKIHCPEEVGYEIFYGLKTDYCLRRNKENNIPVDTNDNSKDFSLLREACPANSKNRNICEQLDLDYDTMDEDDEEEPLPIVELPCSLRINEVLYNSPSGYKSDEYIEIYNQSQTACDITLFTLKEGSANKKITNPNGDNYMFIQPNEYIVLSPDPAYLRITPNASTSIIANCALSLNKTGDTLFLKYQGTNSSFYSYSDSDGADGDDNSLQYFSEGWEPARPTPGRENQRNEISTTTIPTTSDPVIEITVPELRINEIMYQHPTGHNTKKWVEIYNLGEEYDLSQCKLEEADGDSSHKRQIIDIGQGTTISANEYIVVSADSNISQEKFVGFNEDFTGRLMRASMNTIGEEGYWIKLLCNDEEIDSLDFEDCQEASGTGNSLQYFDTGWFASPPTPGVQNLYIDVPPEVTEEEMGPDTPGF